MDSLMALVSRRTKQSAITLFGFVLAVAIAAPAVAGGQRAKLSLDLEERLKAPTGRAARVILSATPTDAETIASRHGLTIRKRLSTGVVLDVPEDRLAALAADGQVGHLSGDVPVARMMAVTTRATGADQVWAGIGGLPGYTGAGIGVAVIDSGVEQHKALKGRVAASFDFVGRDGRDEYGHGTHVASIIAGNADADYPGMAPGAHIVSLRVLGPDGSGDTSDVVAAIDFAIANRARYNLRIINLSLGHPVFESWRDDPLCQAVERAVKAGMVVVASAGNFGKTPDGRRILGGISSPGNSPSAITVAALNTKGTAFPSDDVVASYSSRGLTHIDGLLKPDLAAPGNRIVAAAAQGSSLVTTFPERIVGGEGSNSFIEMSGTSMAAAAVSGAAALLLNVQPSLSPSQVKLALMAASHRVARASLAEVG